MQISWRKFKSGRGSLEKWTIWEKPEWENQEGKMNTDVENYQDEPHIRWLLVRLGTGKVPGRSIYIGFEIKFYNLNLNI